jgi:hypothetical protein
VLRGKYIISNLLNTPPLPPPAVVPDLSESAHKDRPSTVREQLERHRANPVCASCHRNIDPAGFALENYDAVGQWRTATPEGLAIDTAGQLSDGTKIDGPGALRKALLDRPDVFVGTITEKLLISAAASSRWTCRLSGTWSPPPPRRTTPCSRSCSESFAVFRSRCARP